MEMLYVSNDTSLLSRQPALALSYSVILGVVSLTGTIGNLLILVTLATNHMPNVVGTEFIANLALADLLVTAVINPFAILGVLIGKPIYAGRYWLCNTLGSVCIVSCVASLLTIGCISINRYVYIRFKNAYNRIYSRTNSIVMCVSVWIAGVLLDLPSHVGWSRHHFDEKFHKCLWDRSYQYYYTVLFTTGGVFLPLVIITGFYLGIFRQIQLTKQRLCLSQTLNKSQAFKGTMKQARMMFTIFVLFASFWLPFVLVILIDRYDTYPVPIHLFSSLLAHAHASINFIIYGVSNQRFRQNYMKALRCRYSTQRNNSSIGTSTENIRSKNSTVIQDISLDENGL